MVFIGIASFVGVFAMFLVDTSVSAQTPPGTMNGFAWSDASDQADQTNFPGGGAYGRGGGWISFNSDDVQSSTPWAVIINPNTGAMSGYAYSSFLGATYSGGMNPVAMNNASGYIRFTDIGEVPPSGPTAQMARLDIQNGRLEGWARACAVFQSGCSGALLDPLARGGWDGWISLSGTATNGQPYGVNMISYDPITGMAELYGYAWGDSNLGWILFKPVTVQLNPNPPVYCTNIAGGPHYFIPVVYTIDPTDSTLCIPIATNPPTSNPKVSINTGCYIKNSPVSVQWATSAVDPLSCTIDSSPDTNALYFDNFPATSATTSDSVTSGNLTGDTTFLLSCQSLDTPSVTHTAQTISLACPANVAVVNLSNSCTTTSTTTLYWNVDQAVQCTASSEINISLVNGSHSGSVSNVPVANTYYIACTGQDGNQIIRKISPTTSQQCTPTGGGIPRPGYQEI
jgi:hypothetical protein